MVKLIALAATDIPPDDIPCDAPSSLFDQHPHLRPRHRTARPAAAPGGADPRADLDASFNLFISRAASSASRSFVSSSPNSR
ncbi:hypothetical protein VTO73DRAFT_14400 [Trametes versicolor]